MKSVLKLFTSLVFASFAAFGCSHMPAALSGWTTLLDGTQGMDNWTPLGDANWRMVDGMLQADKGTGFLISKNAYGDFQMRVEFWADSDANSGIFLRMSDTKTVTAANSYEVNIFDKRPGQEYSTGAIVDVAKVSAPIPKVGGQWSVYEITAKGSQLTVVLNGVQTVDVQDNKHARGPFSLQYAPGVVKDKGIIKFRKVQIKAL
jgi:Domain of Unknown Function (DUF1080)